MSRSGAAATAKCNASRASRVSAAAATHRTAIGGTINTASRLDAMTKEYRAQAIISEDVPNRAGMDQSAFAFRHLGVRGIEPGRGALHRPT